MLTTPLGLAEQLLLGRYRLERPIAQGGMGAVYRGRDLRLQRPVCIKIFHGLLSDVLAFRASYDHFIQEAFTLSQLCHPNTLRIYDFGHVEDERKTPFQVSELLEGGTLSQWVRRAGARSPSETLGLIGPVAGALTEAHARGIVHRDVKPSNIILALIGVRRIAKLGDFGIATIARERWPGRTSSESQVVPSGMRLFSPGWAAPEQLRGERVTPTADVFALGLVTAFMLGGEPIFSAKDEKLWARERAHSDLHVARKVQELELPGELGELVRKACRADPAQRYQSTEQFAAALREAVHAVAGRRTTTREERGTLIGWDEPKSGVTSSLLLPADDPAPGSDRTASVADVACALASDALSAPVVSLDCAEGREVSVLGRRLRRIAMDGGERLDLGDDAAPLSTRARIRITLLPSPGAVTGINVKGLNCFVMLPGGRPAAAVNIDHDAELSLLASDRLHMDGLRCWFGRPSGNRRLYRLGRTTLSLGGARLGAVLLDLGPGRELVLIHPSVAALCLGGSLE